MQNALLRLRFSTRDAALAARYAAALRCPYADAFETVKLGRDAVAYAAAAFHALGDAAGEARAAGALDALRDAPWSLRELAVGGDALMPLLAARGVPARQMGRLLELFQASRQSNQEADALIAALRPFLREERQKKLDQAIQLAGLSRAARQAYRLWKEGELHL